MTTRYVDPKEFSDLGYLQEANRVFFHPLGMALEITVDDKGVARFTGVQDFRDDPEGMVFKELDPEKTTRIHHTAMARIPIRMKALGFYTQPGDNEVERGMEVVDAFMKAQKIYGSEQTKALVKAIGLGHEESDAATGESNG